MHVDYIIIMKLALISILSLSLAANLLVERKIELEDGKNLYIRPIDSSLLMHYESQVGCSVNCANGCIEFSADSAVAHCMSNCGCESLLSSEPVELSNIPTQQPIIDTVPENYKDDTDSAWSLSIVSIALGFVVVMIYFLYKTFNSKIAIAGESTSTKIPYIRL